MATSLRSDEQSERRPGIRLVGGERQRRIAKTDSQIRCVIVMMLSTPLLAAPQQLCKLCVKGSAFYFAFLTIAMFMPE
jgi:hypothetical protein